MVLTGKKPKWKGYNILSSGGGMNKPYRELGDTLQTEKKNPQWMNQKKVLVTVSSHNFKLKF